MAMSLEDKKILAKGINDIVARIPPFLKGALDSRALTGYLQSIPNNFRNYTLQELIEAIEECSNDNSFMW